MTDAQITAVFAAAWHMLENDLDYCPGLDFCYVYNYWNEELKYSEAWLTDGNPDMNKAIKYNCLCKYSPII